MTHIKLDVSEEIKEKILSITKGAILPFFLRKTTGKDTLTMIFYTKANTVKDGEKIHKRCNIVEIEKQQWITKRNYYSVDKEMNVTPLMAKGRGQHFITEDE